MWNKKYAACVQCETTHKKHMAKGLCSACYMRNYAKEEKNRERITAAKTRWYYGNHEENLQKCKVNREQKHFDGKRDRIVTRDGCCQQCGRVDQLVVHHEDRSGRGAAKHNNTEDNLKTLCRACHLGEHRAEYLAKRMQRYTTPKLTKSGQWSLKHNACVVCGKTTARHAAKGKCSRCYQQAKLQEDDIV